MARVIRWTEGDLDLYRLDAEPRLVREQGLFVAEGRLVVQRMIEDRRCAVRSLLLSDSALRELEAVLVLLPAELPVYLCGPRDFQHITGFDIHRGCLALAERPGEAALERLLAGARLVVVLEAVANADNVGGVFRNAAAFGVDAVLLSPACCDPLYRKAIRTSMGATLRIPFARVQDWPGGLSLVDQAGLRLVALTPRAPAETIDAYVQRESAPRLALLLGSQGPGVR